LKGRRLKLQVFRGDDWISDNGVPPYWAWLIARFEWARDHPTISDSVGMFSTCSVNGPRIGGGLK
jgi:hypothetical protein